MKLEMDMKLEMEMDKVSVMKRLKLTAVNLTAHDHAFDAFRMIQARKRKAD